MEDVCSGSLQPIGYNMMFSSNEGQGGVGAGQDYHRSN